MTILVHINCTGPYISDYEIQPCLHHCIEQYRLFNDDDLYVLTDAVNIPFIQRPGVYPIAIEDYVSPKIDAFHSIWHFPPKSFWTVAVTRFIYIENFMRENDLRHVTHFENDVMLYSTIADYQPTLQRLYPCLGITPGGPWVYMTGFMYIDNAQALADMTTFFIDTLTSLGVDGTIRKYGIYGMDEMQLLWVYGTHCDTCLDTLPILPFGEHSNNFEHFNSVFDPASYGQYVGGTQVDGPGAKPPNHYIGVEMLNNPYDVVWKPVDGLWQPYFSYDSKLAKINNLHIHSKNLHLYRSD